jgi:hypothetical protein
MKSNQAGILRVQKCMFLSLDLLSFLPGRVMSCHARVCDGEVRFFTFDPTKQRAHSRPYNSSKALHSYTESAFLPFGGWQGQSSTSCR